MTIEEATKILRESDVLELTGGDTPTRQAVNLAVKSLEAWKKLYDETKWREERAHGEYIRNTGKEYGVRLDERKVCKHMIENALKEIEK